jgi:hypothetical protein
MPRPAPPIEARPFQPVPKPAAREKKPKGPRIPAELRELVLVRADWVCDLCAGRLDGWDGYSVHHRDPGGMGGSQLVHTAAVCVVLCGSGITGCHGWVESNRWDAEDLGFLLVGTVVRAEDTPIHRHRRQWVIPTGDGWVPAEPLEPRVRFPC